MRVGLCQDFLSGIGVVVGWLGGLCLEVAEGGDEVVDVVWGVGGGEG